MQTWIYEKDREREIEREDYKSSWLQDSGSSWLSCQEGIASEEVEEEVGAY